MNERLLYFLMGMFFAFGCWAMGYLSERLAQELVGASLVWGSYETNN